MNIHSKHTAAVRSMAAALALLASAAGAQPGRTSSECRIVRANQEWQPTRIIVRPSEFVCVAADGLWSHGIQREEAFVPYYGPDGFGRDNPAQIPGAVLKLGALVGKISTNVTFIVGPQLCFVPQATGELMLSMNDEPGAFANNGGSVRVQVAKWPAASIPERVMMAPQLCGR